MSKIKIILVLFVFYGTLIPQNARSNNGMISCAHPIAAEAGVKILQQGGTAIDAAIASAFVLSVVEPYASGIGGGGFLILKSNGADPITIDYRESAPNNIDPNEYYEDSLSFKLLTHDGANSVGVPGVLAGLEIAQLKYGRLKLAEVLQPAIEIATNGFPISQTMYDLIFEKYDLVTKYEKLSSSLLVNGFPLDVDSTLTNIQLADTYKKISENDVNYFYQGELASEIVDEINTNGGKISKEDLANYRAIIKTPIVGYYKGYKIITTAPPSGGTHLIELLNIIEKYGIENTNQESYEYLNYLAQAIEKVQLDKIEYMGDPDFVRVPVSKLISKEYADSISNQISMINIRPIKLAPTHYNESGSTTHISAVDNDGNMIGITQSINLFFGSGLIAGNTGILLNNHLGNFDNHKGKKNSIEPNKRPVSSIAPTIILKDDKPFLIIGTPGGSRIIGTTAQVIINIIDFGMSLSEAIEAPKIHIENSILHIENRINESAMDKLSSSGYKIEKHSEYDKYFGGVNAIIISDDGTFIGASDSRRGGTAIGY